MKFKRDENSRLTRKNYLKESHGLKPSSYIFEYYSSEKEARAVAEELEKEGKFVVEEIIPQGTEFAIWVHPVGDEENKYMDTMKTYAPKFYKEKMKKESYNYIGTDVDEPPRDDKSHKEKVFTVCDQYGPIASCHTKEEAQKVIDEWDADPELYGDKGPQLRIDEEIIDVINKTTTLPDDFSESSLKESDNDSISIEELEQIQEYLQSLITAIKEKGWSSVHCEYNMPHVSCLSIPGKGYIALTEDILYALDDVIEEYNPNN